MSRKIWLLLFTLFLLMLLCVGCDRSEVPKAEQSSEKLTATNDFSGILVMYEDDFKPYSYTDGGIAKGINVDLLREAFRRAGVEVKFFTAPWKRVQQLVEDGQADAFCSPSRTPEREEKFMFPATYLNKERMVCAVKKGSPFIFDGDMSKLSGYTLAYFKGYSPMITDSKLLKTLKIKEFDSTAQALESMLDGHVDAVVNDKFVLMTVIEEMGKTDEIELLQPTVRAYDVYILYTKKKEMSEVAAKIDQALSEMRASGEEQKIIDRYMRPNR